MDRRSTPKKPDDAPKRAIPSPNGARQTRTVDRNKSRRRNPIDSTNNKMKRHRLYSDKDLAIVGAPYLRSIPVPQEGLRKLRSRQIQVSDETTSPPSSSAEPAAPSPLTQPKAHPKSIPKKVATPKPSANSSPPVRKKGRPRLEMRIPIEDQTNVTKTDSDELICQALVAHSSNPVLSSGRNSLPGKSLLDHLQVIRPVLRQPRFPHFTHPAPFVYDNFGVVQRLANMVPGLTVLPGVASDSRTQLLHLLWSYEPEPDLPIITSFSSSASPDDHALVTDISYELMSDLDDSESTLSALEESDTSLAISKSRQTFFESLVPPGITIVSIKNNKSSPKELPPKLHQQEILISAIPNKKNHPTMQNKKAVLIKQMPTIPRTTSSVATQPVYTPCLVIQPLPNGTSNPATLSSSTSQTILLKTAPSAIPCSSRDLSNVTPMQFFGNPSNYLQPIRDESSRKGNIPFGSSYFEVTKANQVDVPKKMQPKAPKTKKETIKKTASKRKTKPVVKRQSPSLPFISDQLSYAPVNAIPSRIPSSRNRTSSCNDCQSSDVRDVDEQCPKLLLDTDICGDCCEKNLATSQYFDHDTVSIIPLNSNMIPIQISSSDDAASDEGIIFEASSPPPIPPPRAGGRYGSRRPNHNGMFSLFPSENNANDQTARLIDKAARRSIGNNPNLELQSIQIQFSPAQSSSSSGFGGTPTSLTESPDREMAFEHLQNVLRQQLPFAVQPTPTVTSKQNIQQVQFDCTTLASHDLPTQQIPEDNRFQFSGYQANNNTVIVPRRPSQPQSTHNTIFITTSSQFVSNPYSTQPIPSVAINRPSIIVTSKPFSSSSSSSSAASYSSNPKPSSFVQKTSSIHALKSFLLRAPTPPLTPTKPPVHSRPSTASSVTFLRQHTSTSSSQSSYDVVRHPSSSNRNHPSSQDARRNATPNCGPGINPADGLPLDETFQDILEFLSDETRGGLKFDEMQIRQFANAKDHQTPPRRMPPAIGGVAHQQQLAPKSSSSGSSPIDLTVRRPKITNCVTNPSDGEVFIDVESVDNGSGAPYRNNVCLLHSEPILRKTSSSPIINSRRRAAPIIRPRQTSFIPRPTITTLPLSTHYTTIPTPSSDPPASSFGQLKLPNPFHRFFQAKVNERQATPDKKIVSGYALQLLNQIHGKSATTPSGRKKTSSRKTPLHPVTGDSGQVSGPAVAKRKGSNRCRSPTMPAAKQHKVFNEFDIVMQMEATEYSMDALDNIPIDQLFVSNQELNLNDYLI